MPSLNHPEGRRSKRVIVEKLASLIINPDKPERLPCLVLDFSKEGFRIWGSAGLRRGQIVDVSLDEDKPNFRRCRVVWVGKAGSKQQGEVGLEIV